MARRPWPPRLACSVAITLAVFLQQPGRLVGDTKLDLSIDPSRFLSDALHLWQPQLAFGELQNQAYGYLFPMGPFFALGHGLGIPMWAVERAWQSLILDTALIGMCLLAERLRIGTAGAQLLGGIAFALSPFVLSQLGAVSVQVWPESLAPWVLLPLVGPEATARPRRAATRSGAAVLAAGGVNATATLVLLVLPVIWLLTCGRSWKVLRRLAAWWTLAVGLATFWWIVPLLQLGRYSPPFLDWIESAATTTSSTGVFAVLSGTSNWLGRQRWPSGPVWPAAWFLVTSPGVVVAEAVLVALGLLGLARRDAPGRRFLVTGLLVGVTLVTFGHPGSVGAAFGGTERSLLDGALVPFRNVAKFDMVVRVPLVLGFVHLAGAAARHRSALASIPLRYLAGGGVPAVALLAVVVVAIPLWTPGVEPPGTFAAIPAYWQQAAAWLGRHDTDGGTAVLLPASQHPAYAWGLPTDEPFQVLATTPWAVRDDPPLGGAGEARLLDTIDSVADSGHGEPGYAEFLRRIGIQWLVVRADLDPAREDDTIPQTAVVLAALDSSPGISLAAGFGPLIQSGVGSAPSPGAEVAVPAVEIFQVDGPAQHVALEPAAATVRVSGGPESLLELANAGDLPAAATVLASEPTVPGTSAGTEPAVVTDGNRRQEVTFGRASNDLSATLAPGQPWSFDRAGHAFVVGDPDGHQTTSTDLRVASVTASSSAGDADSHFLVNAADTAVAGFDSDPGTLWVSGAKTAVGQWVEERFDAASVVDAVSVAAPAVVGPPVSQVRVQTSAGQWTFPVGPSRRTFPLPASAITWIRLTVTGVEGGGHGLAADLKVSVAGAPVPVPALATPDDADVAAGPPTFVFGAEPGADTGCVLLHQPAQDICSPALTAVTEDFGGIARVFDTAQPASYNLSIQGIVEGAAPLEAALPTANGVQVSATSQLVGTPADGPQTLFEDVPGFGWIAAPGDPQPTLTLSFPAAETVTGLVVTRSGHLAASSPTAVTLSAGSTSERAAVSPSGVAVLARPLTARVFRLSFPDVSVRVVGGTPLPVGASSVRLLGPGLGQPAPNGNAPVSIACGQGPSLDVDGTTSPTAIQGTLGAVLTGSRVTITACGAAGARLDLAAGQHSLVVERNAYVTPDAVTLTPLAAPAVAAGSSRTMAVAAWGSDNREVRVGPGAAAWLTVRENANSGWVATLDGRRLASGIIDGWAQGYLVPAGAGGLVELVYAPNHLYQLGLAVGAFAALALVALALMPGGRRRAVEPHEPSRSAPVAFALAIGAAACGLDGGLIGLAVFGATVVVVRLWGRAGMVAGAAGLAAGAAAVAELAGGAVTAGAPLPSPTATATQVLGLIALAAVATSLAPLRRGRERGAALRSRSKPPLQGES